MLSAPNLIGNAEDFANPDEEEKEEANPRSTRKALKNLNVTQPSTMAKSRALRQRNSKNYFVQKGVDFMQQVLDDQENRQDTVNKM